MFFEHKTTHRAVFSKRFRPITPTYKVAARYLNIIPVRDATAAEEPQAS